MRFLAVIFRLGPPNNYKIIVEFTEWPVNVQIYHLMASKINVTDTSA